MNKAVVFDLDGTVYLGNKLIEGVIETMDKLKQLNFEIIFFTNNSSKNRKEIFLKLKTLGIDTSLNKVYNSSYACAIYLIENKINNVYVIGTESFKNELSSARINLVGPEKSEAVVIGLDFKFSYDDIANGLQALQQGAKLIVSNTDKNFPVENGLLKPGCNAIVASLIGSCSKNIKPIIIGKPNDYMLKIICQDWNLNKKNVWVVGDSEESDIAMAKKFGCNYVLVGEKGVNVNNIIERMLG